MALAHCSYGYKPEEYSPSEDTNGPYVVEVDPGCWLSPVDGDPGRTLVLDNAELFPTRKDADEALGFARKLRKFPNAWIIKVELSKPWMMSRSRGWLKN